MVFEVIIMLLAMALPIIYVIKGDESDSEETKYVRTRFTHYPDGRVVEEELD